MLPAGTNPKNQYTRSVDIFAFGLCVLELATKQKLDSHNAAVWPELLDTVQDDETRNFIHRCESRWLWFTAVCSHCDMACALLCHPR